MKKITSSYFFNTISHSKDIDQFTEEEIKKDYSPFVINKMVAQYANLVFFANELNCSHNIPKDQQLYFYNKLIPKKKRRTLWSNLKKDNQMGIVTKYYKVSEDKASEYLKILSDEQIDELEKRMETGGREK